MNVACRVELHQHEIRCRCGTPVTRDQMTRTASGATYYACDRCAEKGRRIRVVERVELALPRTDCE